MKKTCPICGKEFEPKGNQVYCGKECSVIGYKRFRKAQTTRYCEVCGSKFKALVQSRTSKCSACRRKENEEKQSEKNAESVEVVCKDRKCKYKIQVGLLHICNYLDSTGKLRGCWPSECEYWKE